MTEKTVSKLQTFINRCLRRILGIYWPATISILTLWETTGQAPVRQELTSRVENGHGSATNSGDQITALSDKLFFGTRREVHGGGRSRNSRMRDTDYTIQPRGLSWHQLERLSRPMFRDGIIKGLQIRSD